MISFVLRDVLLIAAGFGLYRVWRMAQPSQEWLRLVVAAGFLTRAVFGQAFYWISYLRLPFGRSMQMGNGLWFFAQDALVYYPDALQAADKGVWAIVTLNRTAPSVMFEQVLAVAILLLGHVLSVGLLLNLFCYLGTVAVIVHWSRNEERGRMAAAIAITAISLSPACILWSLQPLKDTFFQFLVVTFVAACAAWQRGWIAPGRRATIVRAAVVMLVMIYAISGIRWYFALAVLLGTCLFLLQIASKAAGRRAAAFASALVLAFLLSRAWVSGARPYIPQPVLGVLTPGESIKSIKELPASFAGMVESSRRAFDSVPGHTSIRVGGAVAGLDARATSAAGAAPAPAKTPVPVSSLPPVPTASGGSAGRTSPVKSTAPATKEPAHTAEKTPVVVSPSPVVAPTRVATPKPVVAKPIDPSRVVVGLPVSRAARLITGSSAVFLPRIIGERLGLIRIGGGRGMFWFVEFDTIVFDLMFLCAFIAVVSRVSASLRNPLVVFVALLTIFIAVPLAYTVTNFGTLFRLRTMIFVGLVLTPLAFATAWRSEEASPDGEAVRPAPVPEAV